MENHRLAAWLGRNENECHFSGVTCLHCGGGPECGPPQCSRRYLTPQRCIPAVTALSETSKTPKTIARKELCRFMSLLGDRNINGIAWAALSTASCRRKRMWFMLKGFRGFPPAREALAPSSVRAAVWQQRAEAVALVFVPPAVVKTPFGPPLRKETEAHTEMVKIYHPAVQEN